MDPAIFETIYREDRWNGGSGPGSDLGFCRPLIAWLRSYIRERRIRSLVDLGCGDLQWMPDALAGLDVRYTGLDAVRHLIQAHRQRFSGWTFATVDVATCDPAALPLADLYWAKDVLQHWPDAAIVTFLDALFAARPRAHVVVANCSGQSGPRRLDPHWHFAPLSPHLDPLARFHPEPLMEWGGKTVVRLHAA